MRVTSLWTRARRPAAQPSPLAQLMTESPSSLGVFVTEGADMLAMLRAETNTAVLNEALARADAVGDTYWREHALRRLVELTRAPDQTIQLGQLLANGKRPEAAQEVLRGLSASDRQTEPCRHAMASTLIAAGAFEDADAAIARSEALDDAHCDHLNTRRVFGLLARGHYAAAADQAALARRRYPGSRSVAEAEIATVSLLEGPDAALRRLEQSSVLRPDNQDGLLWTARLLGFAGRHLEAYQILADTLQDRPWLMPLYEQARLACMMRDGLVPEFRKLLDRAEHLYPAAPELVSCRFETLVELGDMDRARTLMPRIRAVSELRYHAARFFFAAHEGDLDAARRVFQDNIEVGQVDGWTAMSYVNYLYWRHPNPSTFAEALALAEPAAETLQDNAAAFTALARLYVAIGQDDKVADLIGGLPDGLKSYAELRPVMLYLDQTHGRTSRADMDRGWTQHLAQTANPCLNAPTSYPREVRLRFDGQAQILCFTVIFNGIEFVDWFLDYYRRLGVEHFFFVDNGSDDGTLERLLGEEDVSVFENTESFSIAACGVIWVNHLMRRFGPGRWCFHLDMDEAFVFPHFDQGRSLHDFLSYLDENGHESVQSLMVDIYPEALTASGEGNAFERSQLIDRDYQIFRGERPPYHVAHGGLRERMTGRSILMSKAPLVKMRPSFCYVLNNHIHTHLVPSDVTTAVLHYKFIGDINARIDEAVDREQHYHGAVLYRTLQLRDVQLRSEFSEPYSGTAQLQALGLMRSSPEWDAYRDGRQKTLSRLPDI